MTRLGKHQISRLASMANVGMAQVVPDSVSRSLVKRGLMQPSGTTPRTADGFAVLTAAGYRAVADAIDAGQIDNRPDWTVTPTPLEP